MRVYGQLMCLMHVRDDRLNVMQQWHGYSLANKMAALEHTGCSLKTHMNMHLGLKPYQCDKCDSSFRGLDSFSKHKRLHKLEVTCQVCGKGLYKQEYLESHMKKHTASKASNFTLAEKADAVALARYQNCQI